MPPHDLPAFLARLMSDEYLPDDDPLKLHGHDVAYIGILDVSEIGRLNPDTEIFEADLITRVAGYLGIHPEDRTAEVVAQTILGDSELLNEAANTLYL